MSLRFAILGLLSGEPNTGYGLGRMLQTKLNHIWEARLQQIYGDLARLDAEGLVEAEVIQQANRPAKKIYSLTSRGRDALDAWLAQPSNAPPSKSELLARIYCLPRIPPDLAIRGLEEVRDSAEAAALGLRERVNAVERDDDPEETGFLLTLEAALSAAEAQRSWAAWAVTYLRGRLPAEPTYDSGGKEPRRRAADL